MGILVVYIQEVFRSPGFNEMSEDALSFILKSDKLTMDEGDILLKVKEWAHVNSVRTCTPTTYAYDNSLLYTYTCTYTYACTCTCTYTQGRRSRGGWGSQSLPTFCS